MVVKLIKFVYDRTEFWNCIHIQPSLITQLQIRRNLKQYVFPQLYLQSNTPPKQLFYPHLTNSRTSSLGRFLEVGKVLMEIVKMVPELNTVLQDILRAGFQSMEFATLTLQTVNGKRESIGFNLNKRHPCSHFCLLGKVGID